MKLEIKDAGGYHHGDLREALIKAAMEILEERGHEALTLREVARNVGVSHAAPYHHFQDKKALFDSVAMRGFQMLKQSMERAAAEKSPLDGLQAYGLAYTGFAQTHPALFRLMYTQVGGGKTAQGTEDGIVDDLTLDGICRALGCGREQARRINLLLWSCMHGLSMLWLDGQLKDGRLEEKTLELTHLLGPVLRS
jgi:AcrR family transcriptional regulator